MSKHQNYPLEWPIGKPRTDTWRRKKSHFTALAFGKTRDDLLKELKNLGAKDVTLSTNVPVRGDGLPYATIARQPDDPGVAVFFSLSGGSRWDAPRRYYAIACDAYRKVEENLRALVHTLSSMRTIERHGSSQLLEQAMTGFAALPPPSASGWWTVLGFSRKPLLMGDVKDKWRELVQENHPDRGGSEKRMQEINEAMAQAEEELGG